jgi:hypothetical protein
MEHRSADWPEGTTRSGALPADDSGPSPATDPDQAESPDGEGSLPADRGSLATGEGSSAVGEESSAVGEGSSSAVGEGRSAGGEGVAVVRPGTGEPRVDAALRLLDRLAVIPVSEHPELYEQVHAQLSDVLGELDTGPGN